MTRRVLILALTLAMGAGVVQWLSRAEARVLRAPLSDLAFEFGAWRGRLNPDFEPKVVAVLGVDEYVNRTYTADGAFVSLYIGYYESQRTGETIHSPMKCLPGTGWQPLTTGRMQVTVTDGVTKERRMIDVNRYVVQKGSDRYLVAFWYQAHGRAIASEYTAKWQLMLDAVRLNRTDGALIRLMTPIADRESESAADAAVTRFIQALYPRLEPHLPS